uniref:Uncharacterized protein n=1 Tax=Knipowitschia caucasica TaxID=637954 RepID=A0AAV2JI81_KNICA
MVSELEQSSDSEKSLHGLRVERVTLTQRSRFMVSELEQFSDSEKLRFMVPEFRTVSRISREVASCVRVEQSQTQRSRFMVSELEQSSDSEKSLQWSQRWNSPQTRDVASWYLRGGTVLRLREVCFMFSRVRTVSYSRSRFMCSELEQSQTQRGRFMSQSWNSLRLKKSLHGIRVRTVYRLKRSRFMVSELEHLRLREVASWSQSSEQSRRQRSRFNGLKLRTVSDS